MRHFSVKTCGVFGMCSITSELITMSKVCARNGHGVILEQKRWVMSAVSTTLLPVPKKVKVELTRTQHVALKAESFAHIFCGSAHLLHR